MDLSTAEFLNSLITSNNIEMIKTTIKKESFDPIQPVQCDESDNVPSTPRFERRPRQDTNVSGESPLISMSDRQRRYQTPLRGYYQEDNLSEDEDDSSDGEHNTGASRKTTDKVNGVEKPFQCNYCDHRHTSEQGRQKHSLKFHNAEYKADKKLRKASSRNTGGSKQGGINFRVQKAKSYGTQYPCTYCSNSYRKRDSRNKHVRSCHPGMDLPTLDENIDKFRAQKASSYGTEYPCPHCSHSYWNNGSRQRHLSKAHPEKCTRNSEGMVSKPFKCNYCNHRHTTVVARYNHMIKYHNVQYKRDHVKLRKVIRRPTRTQQAAKPADDPQIDEEDTPKWLMFRNQLVKTKQWKRTHRVVSGKYRKYRTYNAAMSKAVKEMEQINKTMFAKTDSPRPTREVEIEVPIIPVECDICQKIFETEKGLKFHKIQMHKGEIDETDLIFGCSYCHLKYKTFSSLRSHHSKRHNSKPKPQLAEDGTLAPPVTFQCELCPRVCETAAGLRQHIAKKHNDDDDELSSSNNESVDDIEMTDQLEQVSYVASRKRCRDDSNRTTKVNQITELTTTCTGNDLLEMILSNSANHEDLFSPPEAKRSFTVKEEPDQSVTPFRPMDAKPVQVKVEREDNYQVSPPTPASSSMSSEMISISRRPSVNSQTSYPLVNKNMEKSPLPLSGAILTRAIQYPSEMMIVWSDNLENDIVSAAQMSMNNCVLCIKNLEMFKLTDKQKERLKNSQIVNFTMLSSDDTTSLWTAVTFGNQNYLTGLKNKLFRNLQDIETGVTAHAQGKTVTNMLRYDDDGLFRILAQLLLKKTIGFNFVE